MPAAKKPTAPPPAPEAAEVDPTENAVAEGTEPRPPFYVCDGKAVTTLRGVLADGEEIKETDFRAEGKQRLADLIKSGHVAKGGK